VVDQFMLGMKMMRKHDPQVQEDGFQLLKRLAGDHVADLIAAYHEEQDLPLRRWLLELIGETRSPAALSVFSGALSSRDESIRDLARAGLQRIGSREARTLLWHHRQDQPPLRESTGRQFGGQSPRP
jgi:hypothetical protein